MERDEIINWFKLAEVKGLGPKRILKLLTIFSNAQGVFNASENDLRHSRILKDELISRWIDLKNSSDETYERIIDLCEENTTTIIPLYAKNYPLQLKFLPDSPLTLFAKGNLNLLNTKKVAVIGSRKSDGASRIWAFKNSQELVRKGVTVVSGGAEGIDFEAHSGAITSEGKTICVLGSGFLHFFPPKHENLFNEIGKKGLLISEHPPSFMGGRISLLSRNRITSGISDAVIAVTATEGGGSMTQLKIAFAQKIPIFCPSLDLGFTPIQGIKEAIEKHKILEINDISPVIEEIEKTKPKYLQNNLI